MSFKPSSRVFTWYYYVIIVVILVVGLGATFYTYKTTARNTQDNLVKDVAALSAVFEPEEIASLVGSEEDLQNEVYLSLKSKLEKIRASNEDVQFVYFLGYRDNNVFFYMDSEPETSEDYSPPGQIYDEATLLDIEILKGLKHEGIEFSTDRWGSWLTSLVTIKQGDQVVAVLGMDVSSEKYFRNLYIYTAIPFLSTIFVLTLILIGLFLRRKEKEYITLKEKLFRVATHDLRSPLTGISWLTETTLMNKDKMRPEDAENIETIHLKVGALLKSVNDLLAGGENKK